MRKFPTSPAMLFQFGSLGLYGFLGASGFLGMNGILFFLVWNLPKVCKCWKLELACIIKNLSTNVGLLKTKRLTPPSTCSDIETLSV